MGGRWPSPSAWLAVGAQALLAAAALTLATTAHSQCAQPSAWLTASEGRVELRRAPPAGAEPGEWQPAPRETQLCGGDTLRTGERSRAALRLSNETTLRLDQNTTLTLSAPSEGPTLLDILSGAINVLTRTPKPFRVRGPYLNAGIEGTEFLVRADADSTQVSVFEGTVRAENAFGVLALRSGESAIATRDGAPLRSQLVQPADAVQWALHYPSILDRGPEEAPALREADALLRAGRIGEAFARLDAVPAGERTPRLLAYRAELLLRVGRVDEASGELERALALDAKASDAHALQAIVAVVRNERERALALAQRAVELDASATSARIALSYAEQAHFRIEAALASAEKAAELAPQSALVWARVAELRMSVGDLDAALEAAKRAAEIEPTLARTQSVLGFAYLTRIETAAAKQAFARAIEYDEGDPLPRLGLGLARIREGELDAGREGIEIAATLDPLNSLVRSYLGKAYYEETRNPLAATQFDLAKQLDLKDPTPHFYDAIRKQTENRPVEALQELEKSIELNDNRAVYRSRLLLDEDLASRAVSLANTYRDLGFNRLATQEAAYSLLADNRNSAAHELLSNSFADLPRHEFASDSEALQYRLGQTSVRSTTSALRPNDTSYPQTPRIQVLANATPVRTAFNEFFSLFDRNGVSAYLDGLVGEQGSRGEQVAFSGNYDRYSFSMGGASFVTSGADENAKFRQDAYQALAYLKATPGVVLYAEGRYSHTNRDGIVNAADPNSVARVELEGRVHTTRAAARIALGETSDFLVTAGHIERDLAVTFRADQFTLPIAERATSHELLWSYSTPPVGFALGASQIRENQSVFGRISRSLFDTAFAYGTLSAKSLGLSAQLGFSKERYSKEVKYIRKSNIKAGLVFSPTPLTTLRFFTSSNVNRPTVVNETIESTQIVGFNQFYADPEGSTSSQYGLAIDQQIGDRSHLGINAIRRKVDIPSILSNTHFRWRENVLCGYWYSAFPRNSTRIFFPGQSMAASVEFELERLSRPGEFTGEEEIRRLTTQFVPVRFSVFPVDSTSLQLTATHVLQYGRLQADSFSRALDSKIWVVDADFMVRLQRYQAEIGVGIKNLFDRDLSGFYDSDSSQPHFAKQRFAFVHITARF
jgi:tetratricopeptide (TPR) repeat protein